MNVTEIHRQAMELADQAFVAKLNGEAYKFQAFTRQAFALERQAALLLENDFSSEPSRSVLFRSAASLALECGELREAERLIALALAGNPPTEIAAELRDLFEQVNFQRQLISFVPTESQLFMNGEAISIKGELRHADSPNRRRRCESAPSRGALVARDAHPPGPHRTEGRIVRRAGACARSGAGGIA